VKRVLLIVVGIIVVAVAAAVIAPSFIDWNKYKSEIAGPIERATGRSLVMNGDLSLSVLPTPRVSASDVRLSTAGGDRDFLTLRSLEVQVALWPLLRGEIQVTSVRLVEPQVFLEVDADGTPNWQFNTGATASASEGTPGNGAAISVERVVIANGVLNFVDAANGRNERIEAITATLTAANLVDGPFAAEGRFSVRQQAVGFDFALGSLADRGTVALRAKLELERGGAVATIQGNLSGLASQPTLNAKVGFEGSDLREALSVVAALAGSNASLIVPGAQSFAFTGQVVGNQEMIALNELALVVGETRATGAVSADLSAPLNVDVTLSLGRIDLDAWANAVAIETAASADIATDRGNADAPPSNPLDAIAGFRGSLTLTGEALTYRGSLVRQLRLAATLADRAVELTALSAMLPGGSDVSVSGRIETVDGQPRFDGAMEAASSDFRAAAGWLGLPLEGIAPGRLRQVSLQSRIRATRELGQMFGIDLRLDSSRITGGIAYAFRARPSFSVDLEVDRLNVDAYLAPSPDAEVPPAGSAGGVGVLGTGALGYLDSFDTNAKVAVESLTVGGRRYGGVKLDAGLLAGELTLRNAAIADAGGAGLVFSGSAGSFASVPSFDTKLTVRAPDASLLARFFGVDLPVDARALGQVDLGGTLIGTAEDLAIDIKADIGDMTAAAAGRVELIAASSRIDLRLTLGSPSFVRAAQLAGFTIAPAEAQLDGPFSLAGIVRGNREMINLDADLGAGELAVVVGGTLNNPFGDPAFNINLQANHPDLERLVRMLGADYRAATVNLGDVKMLADVSGGRSRFTVSRIEGGIGPVNFVGDASVIMGGPRPRIDARLNTSEILVDLFLARPTSGAGGGGAASPIAARGGERWSQEPFDLSGLHAVDARLELRARGLTYGDYALQDPTLVAALENGTLTVDPLSGSLFGGKADIQLTAVADRPARIGLSLSLDGADIEQALKVGAGLDRVTGRFNMQGALTTSGQSQLDLVNNLAGNMSFAARDGLVRGIDLASLSERLGRLNEALDFADLLLRTFEGGETHYDTFEGTFKIDDGVARSNDLSAALDAASGTGTAVVDLPRWRLDMSARARLTDHPQSPDVGLDLSGPIDNPQRTLQTKGLEQYLTQRVGTTLIRKLLKSDDDAAPAPAQPAATPGQDSRIPALPGSQIQSTDEPKPATGNELLRGIIRRLGDR